MKKEKFYSGIKEVKDLSGLSIRVITKTGKELNNFESGSDSFHTYSLGVYKDIEFDDSEFYKVWLEDQAFDWEVDFTIKRVEIFTDEDNELLAQIDKLKLEKEKLESEIQKLINKYNGKEEN